MSLGKRPRPLMKRTTSMTEITFDLNTTNNIEFSPPSDPHNNPFQNHRQQPTTALSGGSGPAAVAASGGGGGGGGFEGLDQRFFATVPPRLHRRHSSDFMETPHFLRSCGLCRRRLVSGRDIYMYRGDTAFCSMECREQQMNQDEKKEKCSTATKKQASASPSTSARSVVSATKGETVAAAL